MQKHMLLGVVLVLLASTITIIYFLAQANFHATGVFWYGATAGFGGGLFLSSLILTILIVATKWTLTKKRSLLFFMLILSALVTATLWFFKPGDSDVWWYGAIAGFFICLLLAFLVLIVTLSLD